jgi:CheY-like chemotaxis protein
VTVPIPGGAARAASKHRLLVVDDSLTHRLWLQALLREAYEVELANDGRSAIDRVAAQRPALVLLDVGMPGMDGLAVCRTLRALPDASRLPIIFVTSQRDEVDLEAGFRSGCTDYITKPVDKAELLAKVESWLHAAAVEATAR